MKILSVISILQIAAILLLYAKLDDLEQGLERPAAPAPAATVISSLPTSRQDPAQYSNGMDEERLRYIIRDELRAELGSLGATIAAESAPPVPRDPVEAERQREQVLQQIHYYSSVGRISDAEMVKLQGEIARLDPAARTAALGALTRAMNSGQLEGQL